tara:strand:+ start:1160 stop:1732 length:573 start_codon:yes stop_codon:yes gene_type:complete
MEKINELFEESTTKAVEQIEDSSIEDLSTLCNKLLNLEGAIGNMEEKLQRLKEKQRELSEQIIPDKLGQLGVTNLKLNDGSQISAETFYRARISADKVFDAHAWLRDNGHGDIIKNILTLTFGQGEDAMAKELVDQLVSQGHIPQEKEAVHPSTLRAFVKEQIESGNNAFDFDVQKNFSVYQGKRTKINR